MNRMNRWRRSLSRLGLVMVLLAGGITAAVAQEKVVLDFPSWQWGQPGYDAFFKEVTAAFVKTHPNVEFRPIPIPLEKYADQQIVRFSSGNPPGIMQWSLFDYHTFAKAGWLQPLDERLRTTDIPRTWNKGFLGFTAVDGAQYGVMLSGSSQMLFVNQAMFRKAGVAVPKTPEAFMDAAKKLTVREGGRVVQYGLSMTSVAAPELWSYGLVRWVTGLGGGITDDKGTPTATSPEVKRAVQMMKELLQAGAIPPGLGRIPSRQAFWEGKAAMLIEGPWVMESIKSQNPSLLPSVEVVPIPFPHQIADASNGLSIGKGQKHADLAWEFLVLATSPEWMQRYAELTGVIPGRNDAIPARAVAEKPWLKAFAEVAAKGRPQTPTGLEWAQNQVYKAIADRLSPVLFGSEELDGATAGLQKDIEAIAKSR
jgi:multiple sugar transport system substrate-binding protein